MLNTSLTFKRRWRTAKTFVVPIDHGEDLTDNSGATRLYQVKHMNNDYLNTLRTQAWKTMGARYNAARRLRRRELVSTASIAMYSAISVGLVILQKTYALEAGSTLDNYITALSTLLALFILVISLVEWGARNGERSAALHNNAEDLNAFQRKIEAKLAMANGQQISDETLEGLRGEYEAIKQRCQHNHEPSDLACFHAQHWRSREFADAPINLLGKYIIHARSWLGSLGLFALCWVVLAGLLFFTPWEDRARKEPIAPVSANVVQDGPPTNR